LRNVIQDLKTGMDSLEQVSKIFGPKKKEISERLEKIA